MSRADFVSKASVGDVAPASAIDMRKVGYVAAGGLFVGPFVAKKLKANKTLGIVAGAALGWFADNWLRQRASTGV